MPYNNKAVYSNVSIEKKNIIMSYISKLYGLNNVVFKKHKHKNNVYFHIHTKLYIQYERYKLKCYILKKESLSIIVSYKNSINQTDTYKI